ncbi:MAG: helix-turn-helix transcriptional regulator [Anaerorhabdus sp.]|uniref:helix-turn-helix transcriptional regulator n=1 Tax=Anaerorhabdus sp. TaxID=1872524 RepID=UPI003A851CB9
MKKIGKKLKNLRGNKSQKEVAEALGLQPSAISMYENDERIPRDEIKIKLARYYNKSVEDIFFE